MAKVEYKSVLKDGLLHFPDQYSTMEYAADYLGISRAKLNALVEKDMLLWDQPKGKSRRCVEIKGLDLLKHPENEICFDPLYVQDGRALQREIDSARHKIAAAANLPPGAVKIMFDLG
ncbi:MAG: hypothetical protein JNK24_05520 [Alphaproteobacteria bacterium]|nr:hypothetical protein [Alphaproteobacteria bacterium]